MKVMAVEEGSGALLTLCQALESFGADIMHCHAIDEDKVIIHRIDAVLHLWSSFTADIERVQLDAIHSADPTVMIAVFAHPSQVADLRRRFPYLAVADQAVLGSNLVKATARAILEQVGLRRPGAMPTKPDSVSTSPST